MEQPIVFEYLDYRAFLKDLFEFRKRKDSYFSYRYFSSKAGFASPNFLKLVTDGKRNLSQTSIPKVAKGFGLKKQERDFFENLVFMNQAVDHDERNRYYRRMMSVKGYTKIHEIAKESYEYFSRWYYPVIREVITFGSGDLRPGQIASLLRPKITAKEAEVAVKLLEKIKLIKRNSEGTWEQTSRDIRTGPEVRSLVVANFHREMLKLSTQSIERFEAKQRDVSALTLSIRRENFPELKSRIISFRKELMELASGEENPDRVVQINIQLFPLTE